MPYRTTWHERGILWEFYGDVTAQEIEEANDEFFRDERSGWAMYQIIDARRVTSVAWSDRDIRKTAAFDIGAQHTIKNVKVAYVSRDEEIISKLEQYVAISRRMNSSWQFKGFADIDDARAWATA